MLKPKFVILENVRGMLSFRLQHRKLSMKQNIGAIEHGVIKLLRRLLSAMKYVITTLAYRSIVNDTSLNTLIS